LLPKTKIDRRRLYQQIADDIEKHILNGSYSPGTKLPGEHVLAEQYGVSRNVIRETLKRLKERGLVVIRTGSGTYVSSPSTKPVSDALQRLLLHASNDVPLSHFYEIRRMLEPQTAYLAAERASNTDLKAIEDAFNYMELSRNDLHSWTQADLDFHLAVASATHNPLITSILDPLTEPLRRVISAGHYDPTGTEAGLEAHKKILDAIRKPEPEAAYQSMLSHLIDSERRLSKVGFLLDE
jgi:DNA-binding FadR family transcriptional regulator